MSSHKLREDKNCQNCGHTVEETFCPNCGQKNTETRQTFGSLFAHFLEDLTHYDTAFWKTIKHLLFRPALLTKEYLSGKRQTYVPPVKLYIFISFVTFFLPAVMPDLSENEDDTDIQSHKEEIVIPLIKPSLDRKEGVWMGDYVHRAGEPKGFRNPVPYRSVREMDSIEALKPDSLKLSAFERKLAKNQIKLYANNTPEEIAQKFAEKIPKNVSKAIFIYMPIFAFWLWLFHGKKRWYLFDHAIFTLHYFSFLLLTMTVGIVVSQIMKNVSDDFFGLSLLTLWPLLLFWQVYYFYKSHRKMYSERLLINMLKSTALFIINFVAILTLVIIFGIYTYHTLH